MKTRILSTNRGSDLYYLLPNFKLSPTMEEKITDLEIRMTHQEVTLEELTRTVLQQERLLLELQNELKQVREQLRGFSIIASAAEETPPPHY